MPQTPLLFILLGLQLRRPEGHDEWDGVERTRREVTNLITLTFSGRRPTAGLPPHLGSLWSGGLDSNQRLQPFLVVATVSSLLLTLGAII